MIICLILALSTIGTVEWESDDGTKIASEAGAVFRETGPETRVVSAPAFSYNYRTNTFTLPVVTITGEEELGTGDIKLTHNNVTTHSGASIVEDEHVTITIKSECCVGWETYFIQEVGSNSIQEYCGDNRKVVAQIGYVDIKDSFESGVNYHPEGDVTDSHGNFEDIGTGQNRLLDDLIDELISDAQHPNESGMDVERFDEQSEPIEAGTYFVDGDLYLKDGESTEIDLSEGNVTLIVEEDVLGNGDLNVMNPRISSDRNWPTSSAKRSNRSVTRRCRRSMQTTSSHRCQASGGTRAER